MTKKPMPTDAEMIAGVRREREAVDFSEAVAAEVLTLLRQNAALMTALTEAMPKPMPRIGLMQMDAAAVEEIRSERAARKGLAQFLAAELPTAIGKYRAQQKPPSP